MKARLLFLCLSVLAGSLQAQYYQNKNGSNTPDVLNDGTTVIAGGQGNLMAGTTQVLGSQDLIITRTSVTGVIGGGNTFNRFYRLTDISNNPLNADPCKILQVGSGNICVVGSYRGLSTAPPGIFIAILSPNGNPLSVRGLTTSAPNISTQCFATSATRSLQNVNHVFICGASDATLQAGLRPLVISYNTQNNTIIFARLYNFTNIAIPSNLVATDLAGSPYITNAGTREIFITGNYQSSTSTTDVFNFLVNTTTGAPWPVANFYSTGAVLEAVSVSPATGTGGGGRGFVIAATLSIPGAQSATLLKVDSSGSVLRWASRLDYTGSLPCLAADVIQRRNTLNQWNYYVAATAQVGLQGGQDMAVFQVDDNGTATNLYTYGTPANETASEISGFDPTPATGSGLVTFGNAPGATPNDISDEYYVKSYYNGVTPCSTQTSTPITNLLQLLQASRTPSLTSAFSISTFNLIQPTIAPTVTTLCYSLTVVGGSNIRLARDEEEISAEEDLLVNAPENFGRIFPNPVSISAPLLNLQMNSSAEQQLEIRITDMLGREVLNQQLIITEGNSAQTIQLPSGIEAGVYTLTLTGTGVRESHRFVIQ
jgi:hypothetical protein